jgi:hypothetical protein
MRTNEFLKEVSPEDKSWVGKVTLSFSYPSAGWIQFAVLCTAHVQSVVVDFSNVFDPFPQLVNWLTVIANGDLPTEFEVDEEGVWKIFRAVPVNQDEFVFEILDAYWNKEISEEQPIYLYARLSKKQFLSEFLKRWDDFLENQYDPAQWENEEEASQLRKLDFSRIREFVKG